jgi:hypothetical protein
MDDLQSIDAFEEEVEIEKFKFWTWDNETNM